jgi:hypothetical protein
VSPNIFNPVEALIFKGLFEVQLIVPVPAVNTYTLFPPVTEYEYELAIVPVIFVIGACDEGYEIITTPEPPSPAFGDGEEKVPPPPPPPNPLVPFVGETPPFPPPPVPPRIPLPPPPPAYHVAVPEIEL